MRTSIGIFAPSVIGSVATYEGCLGPWADVVFVRDIFGYMVSYVLQHLTLGQAADGAHTHISLRRIALWTILVTWLTRRIRSPPDVVSAGGVSPMREIVS